MSYIIFLLPIAVVLIYRFTLYEFIKYKFSDKASRRRWNAIVISLILIWFLSSIHWDEMRFNSHTKNNNVVETSSQKVSVSNGNINLNDGYAVKNYLSSKSFRYATDNMSIKFYPEGYYELSHNYQVAMTGKWTVGNEGALRLESDEGNLNMTLSSEGTITDNGSSRVFQ